MKFMMGEANINGTSLQGYVTVSFSKLVSVFGEPEPSPDGYRVAFQWRITFADGTVASIYDYKASSLYDDDAPTPEQLRASDYDGWHIGGRSKHAVELVVESLGIVKIGSEE